MVDHLWVDIDISQVSMVMCFLEGELLTMSHSTSSLTTADVPNGERLAEWGHTLPARPYRHTYRQCQCARMLVVTVPTVINLPHCLLPLCSLPFPRRRERERKGSCHIPLCKGNCLPVL